MVQQGQVFKSKAEGVDGQPLSAYRYRLERRGSVRPQVRGFKSGQAADDLADGSAFIWWVRADDDALSEARLDRLARLWRRHQLGRVDVLKVRALDGYDVPLHLADSAPFRTAPVSPGSAAVVPPPNGESYAHRYEPLPRALPSRSPWPRGARFWSSVAVG
jgi:hypothetical protein